MTERVSRAAESTEFGPSQALPFVHALSRAVNTRAIYPASHPNVAESLRDLERAKRSSLVAQYGDEIQIVVVDGALILDGRPLLSSQVLLKAFTRGMQQLGVESLKIGVAATTEECERLVAGLSGVGELKQTSNVAIGRIQVTATDTMKEAETELTEADLDLGAEAFFQLRTEPNAAVARLDHFVWSLMRKSAHTHRSQLLLPALDTPDRALYHHSLNVALLTLAQAESLGIRGQMRHDLGLAALLHDVGKLQLPAALMERNGRLGNREWQVARLHPELGAALLAGLEAAPQVAVLVAYEHHWRYDRKRSFPEQSTPRAPGFASQLTAVADTYDTMIASRGLEGGAVGEAATRIWQQRAGTVLDPILVAHFIRVVRPHGAREGG